MKGYIVVISDRDPTREVSRYYDYDCFVSACVYTCMHVCCYMQVKIVAEDEDTVEYARKIIFSQVCV